MTEPPKRWLALNIPPERIQLDAIVKRIKEITYKYHRPSITKMASPAFIEALKDAANEDPKLENLISAFADDSKRLAMQDWAINFIIEHVRFQIGSENTINIAIYGIRGTGKTEVGLAIALLELAVYFDAGMTDSILGMSRAPSIANWLLGRATEQKKPMVLVEDESEREFSAGSQKEFVSLIQNMDTMRVLRHSLILLMITLGYMGDLVSRCDFALRSIFSDRINRVNWCILYTVNLSGKELVPKAIVGLPIHDLEDLRAQYKDWKYESQLSLTGGGGAHGASTDIVRVKAHELARYAEEHGLDEYSARRLEEVLRDEIPGGGDMVLQQQTDTALFAQRLLGQGEKSGKGKGTPEEEPRFTWSSDFTWAEKVASLIQKHRQFKKYYNVFVASEVMGLNPYKDQKEFESITKQKLTANKVWVRRMNRDDEFQGWLKQTRSTMHEKFVSQKLRKDKWTVTEKPHFTYGGVDYEEDLYAEKGDIHVWLNCKCGSGNRTYTSDEYITTWILANKLDVEAYVLYLDLEANSHDIWLPAEHFSVGSKHSPLSDPSDASSDGPSTPILLLAALEPQQEGKREARVVKKARAAIAQERKAKAKTKSKAKPKAAVRHRRE